MKIPKAEQLPSGNWRCRVTINGNRVSFIKEEEQAAVNAAMLAMLSTNPNEDERKEKLSSITLRSAVQDYIDKRENILSPSTLKSYDSILRNRLQGIMDLPLTARIDWQAVLNDEAEEISAKTLKNVWGLINGVLNEYDISAGKVRLPQVVRVKRPFLQPKEIKTFVKAVKGHKYELPYLLCLHGLRRSEMLALTKKDVTKDTICVRGAVVQNIDGEYIRKDENKNPSSRRNVPVMLPRVYQLAKNSKTDVLCPWKPSTMHKPLNDLCKSAGITVVSLHDLRRSYASLCYHLGVSEAQTMEWGGWSDASTMRKIYIQIAEQDRIKKAEELKKYFR